MTDKTLLDAMLAVQLETPTLPKDKVNPHFKSRYTPLDTIVETVGPILAANKLVWTTLPVRDDHGDPALRYRLMHAPSGEVLEGTMPLLLSKQDAQGMGSALTYARRYALCAVLNLVADDDDDGNAAAAGAQRGDKPTDKQLKYLRTLVTQHAPSQASIRAMLTQVGAGHLADTPRWTPELTRQQCSDLIEIFKSGTLPDPEAVDVPSDVPVEPVRHATPAEEPMPWDDDFKPQQALTADIDS
jgi:hypothetical protein